MANKKKNASANPNLDTVKDVFRKNRHITNRIQQKTVFEATDLSEKYYARRIKAVMHLLPEMKKRYAAKYPEMDMVSEFAEAASFPSITYDIIDWQMDVCLGAAVWLLDRIWEQEKMQQLCDLLPKRLTVQSCRSSMTRDSRKNCLAERKMWQPTDMEKGSAISFRRRFLTGERARIPSMLCLRLCRTR